MHVALQVVEVFDIIPKLVEGGLDDPGATQFTPSTRRRGPASSHSSPGRPSRQSPSTDPRLRAGRSGVSDASPAAAGSSSRVGDPWSSARHGTTCSSSPSTMAGRRRRPESGRPAG